MATVIDALLITLGIDATALEKGAEKANTVQKKIEKQAIETGTAIEKQEKKTEAAQVERGKQLELRSKQIALGVSKLRNEALALFAVFTGGVGIKNFLASTLNTEAGLERMSSNLGMTASELAMWQLANERAGGSTAGMTEQIKEANGELAKMRSGIPGGSEKILEIFKWASIAGVSGIDIDSLKTGTDVLMARSKVLQALSKTDPAKAQIAAAAMGVSEDTFNLLKQGPALVEQQRQAQKKLADEMARNAPAAEAFRKQWNDMMHGFEAMTIQVLPKLMPYLERLANWLISIIPTIESFAKKIDGAVESLGGWTNVLIALGALKLVSMAGGLTAVGVALNGIAATLGFIGGAVGVAALATLTGIGLLTASAGLNKGEDAELARRRKMAPTIDGPTGAAAAGGNLPRGMRNNNPGNIEYGPFAKKHGATGSDGRFAIFATMEAGQAAQQALLGGYLASGANTVSKAINRWAPSSENNTAAYVAAVSKQIGVGPDQPLNSSHLPALADAISRHENGAAWGRRNAEAAANMPMGAAASARAGNGGNTNSTSTTDVRVGTVNVQTQATDAPGIAKSIGGALEQYGFAMQANTGLA